MDEVAAAVARTAREDGGRVLAALAQRHGDLDLADDAVQEALLQALRRWPRDGVPDNPGGWLMTVASRRLLDLLRGRQSARRRALATGPDLLEAARPAAPRHLVTQADAGSEPPDERLRLLLLCCHPALHRDAQVSLTLRLVGGLTTAEIAAGLLVPESTVSQRLVRAKRKIRQAGIPLSLPERLDERVDAVLDVLYLVFNEAYLPRAGADEPVRVDLADEAVRLTRLVATLLPEHAETGGLLALMLFHRARFAARVDAEGSLVLLADQDRTAWDPALLAEDGVVLARTLGRMRPGPRQLEAVIASRHATARTAAETDWPAIATAYGQLAAMTGSPVVRLNRAVAIGMADGPAAGLHALEEVRGLAGYHLLHAVRADLLARDGDPEGARGSLLRARDLATHPAERALLQRRLDELGR